MDIIRKDRNQIFYNPKNTIIPPDDFLTEDDRESLAAEKERVRQRQLS
jgi:hypothetical protein